jgi:hypothetical protein
MAQQLVQLGHATQNAGSKFNCEEDTHILLFSVENEYELKSIYELLLVNKIDCLMFFEPDINQYTAICTKPFSGNSNIKKYFKRYI